MVNPVIDVQHLTKIYNLKDGKKLAAVDDVTFQVPEHEIFGILGPNGAGKTTLINLLSTFRPPTSGNAFINGLNISKDISKIRSLISLMPDFGNAYYRLTGFQNLKFWAKIYGIKDFKEKITPIIEEFGLSDWMNEYCENYSLGMIMKLCMARIFLQDSSIWFLDEPTRGMDVTTVNDVIEILKKKKEMKNIIITSHDLSVMGKLCNRIAIINHGKILAIDTQERLKNLLREGLIIEAELEGDIQPLMKELASENYVLGIKAISNGISFELKNRDSYAKVLSILSRYRVKRINEKGNTLEDIVLKFYRKER